MYQGQSASRVTEALQSLNYLNKMEKKRSIPINCLVANGVPDSSDYIIEFKAKDIS